MKLNNIYDCIERLSELIKVDSRQAGIEHGLQPVQIEVLHYLSICNRYSDTPMAVTEYLGQTKGTVSQTLKVLEIKGFIVKKFDEDDKRIVHLKVSAKGKRLLDKIIPTDMFVKACRALTEKKQSEIESALKLLLITLLQENNMKTFGVCESCRHNKRIGDNEYYCDLIYETLSKNDIQLICKEHEN